MVCRIGACGLLAVGALATFAPAGDARARDARAAADGRPLRPGQHVNFYASDARCTVGFLVRFSRGGTTLPAALTAGHCSRYPRRTASGFARERVWRVRGRNRPPATNLGLTLANALGQGPDVLAFSITGARGASQRIDRRSGKALKVVGWVRTSRQRRGLRVCMTGRSSGTRCGRLSGRDRLRPTRRITCTTIPAQTGDSGAPVYTPARGKGVRAVGIVKASHARGLCFTPVGIALRALGANFYG